MSALVPTDPNASPFDAIRREDTDGEFWSARDLMPLLGYERWERFADAIERAQQSAQNTGADPSGHFAKIVDVRGAEKINDQGYRQRDYRLTRYACYLTAMNGDPRKREVAAAQTYFAVKTREAETGSYVPAPASPPALPDMSTGEGQLAVLDMFREQVTQRMALERELDETHAYVDDIEPDAHAYRTIATNHVGDYSAKEAASFLSRDPRITIGQNKLLATLRRWKVLDPRDYPYAAHGRHFHLKPQFYGDPHTGEQCEAAPQVRITWEGLSYVRRRLLGELDTAATQDALFPAPARGQRRLALPGPATKAAPPGATNAGRGLDPTPSSRRSETP